MRNWLKALSRFVGTQPSTSHAENVISAVGAALSIGLIYFISHWATDFQGAAVILPSMGASAVLLFAVPHGALSQPWPLVGGNVVSACIGVFCAQYVSQLYLSAALAVGVSIAVMHYLRCIHPPGGATALAAVIGGQSVSALGFGYVVMPTLVNCLVILAVALAFNNLYTWRRYPSSLMKYEVVLDNPETVGILPRHIEQAMGTLDEVVVIAPEQIKYIVDKANEILQTEQGEQIPIEVGAFYSNGKQGPRWSVREVIDTRPSTDAAKYLVVYRVVDGAYKGKTDSVPLVEFSAWAATKIRHKR